MSPGSCTLGDIPANGAKSFDISVLVHADATGVITNRASVSSSTTEARPGDESVPAAGATAAEPVASVRRWAEAWSGRRVTEYLGFYAAGYRPLDGMSRGDWEAFRRARIEEKRSIDVRLSGIEVESLGPDRARVGFDQDYRSDDYSDRVRKTLELVREGERWLILAERTAD